MFNKKIILKSQVNIVVLKIWIQKDFYKNKTQDLKINLYKNIILIYKKNIKYFIIYINIFILIL